MKWHYYKILKLGFGRVKGNKIIEVHAHSMLMSFCLASTEFMLYFACLPRTVNTSDSRAKSGAHSSIMKQWHKKRKDLLSMISHQNCKDTIRLWKRIWKNLSKPRGLIEEHIKYVLCWLRRRRGSSTNQKMGFDACFPCLHSDVSVGKKLNPKFPLQAAPAVHACDRKSTVWICVCKCVNVTYKVL